MKDFKRILYCGMAYTSGQLFYMESGTAQEWSLRRLSLKHWRIDLNAISFWAGASFAEAVREEFVGGAHVLWGKGSLKIYVSV